MRAVGSASAPVVALGAPGFESAGSMGRCGKCPAFAAAIPHGHEASRSRLRSFSNSFPVLSMTERGEGRSSASGRPSRPMGKSLRFLPDLPAINSRGRSIGPSGSSNSSRHRSHKCRRRGPSLCHRHGNRRRGNHRHRAPHRHRGPHHRRRLGLKPLWSRCRPGLPTCSRSKRTSRLSLQRSAQRYCSV